MAEPRYGYKSKNTLRGTRAKVEHPFRVNKRQFKLADVQFKGRVKNTAHVITLIALFNLWMARRGLIKMMGVVRSIAA